MQVIRGTRAPFLAAACALLVIGAGAADSPVSAPYYIVTFSFAPLVAGGLDGCPVLAGSTFDSRKLCAADLGVDWDPVGARDVQMCPTGPAIDDAVLSTGSLTVNEDIVTTLNAVVARGFVVTIATADCAAAAVLFGEPRKVWTAATAGTSFETQSVRTFPRGGGAILTAMAIGNVVLTVGVSSDERVPDDATVLRIVDAAAQRFNNPRPSGGPFAPASSRVPVVSPAS